MSNGIENAFNSLLMLHKRAMTISRPDEIAEVALDVTPSNYSRIAAAPEEVVIEGREYLISKKKLTESGFGSIPKRGDVLTDLEIGTHTITEVREMFGFGGKLIGYRVRTG